MFFGELQSTSTGAGANQRGSPCFSFFCGCIDSKSIAIFEPSLKSTPTPCHPHETLSSGNTPIFASQSSCEIPSFSGLLHQFNDLEQNVKSRGPCRWWCWSDDGGRLEKSMAVVKASDDPMMVIIIEKEIVDGEELCELVDQFISLSSPWHHYLIL